MTDISKIHAVIIGDLVNPPGVDSSNRSDFDSSLKEIFDEVNGDYEKDLDFLVQRSNTFVKVMINPEYALEVALYLKARIKMLRKYYSIPGLDIRVSIGVGLIEQLGENVSHSDGQAFRFAGTELDKLSKFQQFTLRSSFKEMNISWKALSLMVDTITDGWSYEGAEAVWFSLKGLTQSQIAKILDISQSAVNFRLRAAHWRATKVLIKTYHDQLNHFVD
ncbi:hypothetical protein OO013_17960 [Mangrovivirga sp. M17]|uniref:SatD family protein n=1 Tax=Mangrovivirga halotolerans TaxID=2993936 RepID=A0ABT3RVW5_9BACT|nr:hypothetical protein [Mangrovivirga halotolerans]MCX2745773.1 hypothetical protein [Mangrovivirga halotolerans]